MSEPTYLMRKFIITSTQLDYMFELKGSTVRRVATLFDEQILPPIDEENEVAFDLPREIAYRCIKEYLKYLMKEHHFDIAFQLLCIDRFFINQMYYGIYGVSNLTFKEKVQRLAWSFKAAMELYDYFLCAPNLDSHDFFAISLEYFDGWNLSTKHPFYPWDFDITSMQLIAIEPPLLDDGNWNVSYHAFHAGRNYGDTVWIQGSERRGIFRALQFMRPIITFILRDGRNNLLSITRSKEVTYFFYRFAQFLQLCFGRDTRVFFAIDTLGNFENPFIANYVLKDGLKCMLHQ